MGHFVARMGWGDRGKDFESSSTGSGAGWLSAVRAVVVCQGEVCVLDEPCADGHQQQLLRTGLHLLVSNNATDFTVSSF